MIKLTFINLVFLFDSEFVDFICVIRRLRATTNSNSGTRIETVKINQGKLCNVYILLLIAKTIQTTGAAISHINNKQQYDNLFI